MFFIEKPLVYKELLFSKIQRRNKILIIDDNKDYNNIFDNIDIIKKLDIEIHIINVKKDKIDNLYKIAKEKDYDKIKFFSNDIFFIDDTIKYNSIIFFDIFCKFNDENIEKILEKSKLLLKNINSSNLIFINNIITKYNQYMYHPFSYIRGYLCDNCVYITDIYDKIRNNGLYVIDSDRLFTFNIPTYPVEIFSIICMFK
jgi:hypothetical protein